MQGFAKSTITFDVKLKDRKSDIFVKHTERKRKVRIRVIESLLLYLRILQGPGPRQGLSTRTSYFEIGAL